MDKSERKVSARWVAFWVSGLCTVGLMGSAGFAEEQAMVPDITRLDLAEIMTSIA